MSQIDDLTQELSALLNLPFTPDPKGSYSYQINHDFSIQLEISPHTGELILGSFLVPLPVGSFRENILNHALKANYLLNEPSFFAFSEKSSTLFLYQAFDSHKINAQKLFEHLAFFIEKAVKWKEAIGKGQNGPFDFLQKLSSLK